MSKTKIRKQRQGRTGQAEQPPLCRGGRDTLKTGGNPAPTAQRRTKVLSQKRPSKLLPAHSLRGREMNNLF